MAENIPINLKLPTQMDELIGDLQALRKSRCEPSTKTAVVIDAIKQMHRREIKR